MAKFSKAQIAIMARGAGWGARSADAAEVAMAESGGDSSVVNSIGCVGLMQINQPVHVKAHPKWTRAWLKDPVNNLEAALVLYKAAGSKFDGPWLDSRDKGGGGGWGDKVSSQSGGVLPVADDPCKGLIIPGLGKDHPGYKKCREDHGLPQDDEKGGDTGDGWGAGGLDPFGVGELAGQLGRLAQAVAKAGNWLSEPKNWVRVAYVAGGAALGITAAAVIIRPYSQAAYRQVRAVMPVQTTKKVAARMRRSNSEETSGE